MQTDNKTLLGIRHDGERSLWITWNIVVFLVSLIGDSIILIATTKYKAIKHHKVIVAVMQHMAVCDILQTVSRVFPSILSLTADRWVLGKVLCHAEENITYLCGGVTLYLTCALTTFKLIVVKYPLRTGAWSSRLGHRVCACLWLFELCVHFPILAVNVFYLADTLHFSYRVYNCGYNNLRSPSAPTWFGWYFLIAVGFITLLCYTILVLTSIILLVVAKRAGTRHGEELQWMGILTVLLTVGVLLLSYPPSLVVIVVGEVLGVHLSSTTWRAVAYLQYVNIMANFFVYAMTVRSFRQFLKLKINQMVSLLGFPSQQRQRPRQQQQQQPHQQQKSRRLQSSLQQSKPLWQKAFPERPAAAESGAANLQDLSVEKKVD